MKKMTALLVGIAFSLSMAGLSVAQQPAAPATEQKKEMMDKKYDEQKKEMMDKKYDEKAEKGEKKAAKKATKKATKKSDAATADKEESQKTKK